MKSVHEAVGEFLQQMLLTAHAVRPTRTGLPWRRPKRRKYAGPGKRPRLRGKARAKSLQKRYAVMR